MWIPASLARWLVSLTAILLFQTASNGSDTPAGGPAPLATEVVSRIDNEFTGPRLSAPGLVKLPAAGKSPPAKAGGEFRSPAERLASPAKAETYRPPSVVQLPRRSRDLDADGRADRVVVRNCRVTAYCDRGLTAAGVPSGVGQCAAPGDIPLGSMVYIPELDRHFVVTDRTHKRFRHNTVDLFIPQEAACWRFGVQRLTCEFTIFDRPAAYGSVRVAPLLAAARSAANAVTP